MDYKIIIPCYTKALNHVYDINIIFSVQDTYRCILRNSYRIPATVSPEATDLITWMLRPKPKSRPTLTEIESHQFFKKVCWFLWDWSFVKCYSSLLSFFNYSILLGDSKITYNLD